MQFSTIPGLVVGEDRVAWTGGEFLYADVENITTPRTFKSAFGNRINFYSLLIRAFFVDEGGLVLHAESGRQIRFALSSALNYPGQGRRIADLRALKQQLIERTFPYRVERYERALRETGVFTHGGYSFHRDGSVHSNGERLFSLRDPGFALVQTSGHEIAMMPEKSAVAYFTSKLHTIDLLNNGDCIVYLLDRAYGLSFRGGSMTATTT